MPRTATVRSASLAPPEAELADALADAIAGGSFTELTRLLLQRCGRPIRQRLDELRESGLDPNEQLFVTRPTPPDTEEQARQFYAPSTWPADGPTGPPYP
jgi:hypothetical protein